MRHGTGKRMALAAAIAFLYLYPFPYFEGIRSANELPRVYLTMAMVEEGTFAIDTGVKRWGSTADVSPSGGHHYSNKAPGSSMLAIPGYLIARAAARGAEPSLAAMTWASRITTGVIPTLLFLLLLFRFLRRFAGEDEEGEVAAAALVAYALGSMAMTYSILFIAHQLSAVAIGTAFILSVRIVEEELDPRWMFAVGFAAGAAPLIDYQAAFAGVPLAIYLVVHLARRGRAGLAALGLAAASAAIPIAILLGYHTMAFGGPFETGYHASETFAHFHQRGFLGLDRFRWEALIGSTVSPENGLIFFSPFLLLALWGWVELGRRRQWWILGVTASVVAIYLAFISSIAFWRGGWQLGPRYIVAMLPFAMVPVTAGLAAAESRWWTRGIAWGLILVSIAVYATSAAQFPHFPEKLDNPLFELTWRLYRDGHAPYSLGWAAGLRGLSAQVPYLLVLVAAVALVLQQRRGRSAPLPVAVAHEGGGARKAPASRRWPSALLAIAVAAAVLGLYSTFPGGGAPAEEAYEFVISTFPR
jgi:hypothetical protein